MSFPNHNSKGNVMMVSSTQRDDEGDTLMQPDGESKLDKMAQWVKSLFKLRSFYGQMYFNLEYRLR